jgi:hypothetical protein
MSRDEKKEKHAEERYRYSLERYYHELSQHRDKETTVGNEELKLRLFLSLIERPASEEWRPSAAANA